MDFVKFIKHAWQHLLCWALDNNFTVKLNCTLSGNFDDSQTLCNEISDDPLCKAGVKLGTNDNQTVCALHEFLYTLLPIVVLVICLIKAHAVGVHGGSASLALWHHAEIWLFRAILSCICLKFSHCRGFYQFTTAWLREVTAVHKASISMDLIHEGASPF